MTPLIKGVFVLVTTGATGAILVCFAVVGVASFYKILGVTTRPTLANYLDFTANQAIYNSIRVSLVAALIGAFVGVLLAYAAGKNAAGRVHEDGEFGDVGATICAWLGAKHPGKGAPGRPILER